MGQKATSTLVIKCYDTRNHNNECTILEIANTKQANDRISVQRPTKQAYSRVSIKTRVCCCEWGGGTASGQVEDPSANSWDKIPESHLIHDQVQYEFGVWVDSEVTVWYIAHNMVVGTQKHHPPASSLTSSNSFLQKRCKFMVEYLEGEQLNNPVCYNSWNLKTFWVIPDLRMHLWSDTNFNPLAMLSRTCSRHAWNGGPGFHPHFHTLVMLGTVLSPW